MIDDPRSTILLIEDDPATRTFLADNLTADGYTIRIARGVREGAHELRTQFPDLVVVDVGLPDGSGLDLVRAVRRADGITERIDPKTPLLVLSGRSEELDRIRGLEQGADDYLCKPFGYGELRCRIKALLRRTQERPNHGAVRIGALVVDPVSREVRVNDARVDVSQKEFALLRVLVSDPTRVWTKERARAGRMGDAEPGFLADARLRTPAVCVRSSRASEHQYVLNVWGVGYRLLDGNTGVAE